MLELLNKLLNKLRGYTNPGLFDEVDHRTFGLHTVLGNAEKKYLTDEDFEVELMQPWINQGSTDFCVGTGKAYFKELTEGIKMSWAGAYAMGARAMGSVPKWGISILQVMKGAVKYGVPEESFWKFKEWNGTKKSGRNYFANWRNMPREVLINAEKHKDKSFFIIYGQWDMDRFDQFRAYLNKFKKNGEIRIIQTGVDAHNVTLFGQEKVNGEVMLKSVDSYGTKKMKYRTGLYQNGYRYFNRKEANRLFNGYVALDIPRETAELINKYNGKAIKKGSSPDCYIVLKGKKRLLKNEAIAWSHGIYLSEGIDLFTLSNVEFNNIPTGSPVKYEDGKNKRLVRAMTDKIIVAHPKSVEDLINED